MPQKKEHFLATGNHLLSWIAGYSKDVTVGKVRSLIHKGLNPKIKKQNQKTANQQNNRAERIFQNIFHLSELQLKEGHVTSAHAR